jgi:hypothetical protein
LFTWYGVDSCVGAELPALDGWSPVGAGDVVGGVGWFGAGSGGSGIAACRLWQAKAHTRSTTKVSRKRTKRGINYEEAGITNPLPPN